MSENYNVVNEPVVDQELIPCSESLGSIHCDKIEPNYVEGTAVERILSTAVVESINLDSYINSPMDISEPIESCEDLNSLVITEKSNINTINNKEIEIEDTEKQMDDDKLMNIDNENTLDQMDIDATGSIDTELPMSVSDDQNNVMYSNNDIQNITVDESDQVTDEDMTDLSATDELKNVGNNDLIDLNDKEINSKVMTFSEDNLKDDSCSVSEDNLKDDSCSVSEDNLKDDSCSVSEDNLKDDSCSVSREHLNQSNMVFNSEAYEEQQVPTESSETPLKTNSRPQRQAAKKAENQIREIAKEIIKPLDSIEEKVIDSIEQLSSPLKKVCSQCNRFRLCKFTVKVHKAMYLCQEDCVDNYRRMNEQRDFVIKCEQCQLIISQNENKNYCWQTKHFCSADCLSQYQNTVFDSNCINCQNLIKLEDDSGKYFRFISGKILQFCDIACSEAYEREFKSCSFCQKELDKNERDGFCSSFCQTKDYESRKKHIEPDSSVADYGINETKVIDKCNVCFCKFNSSFKNEIRIFNNTNTLIKFCSNECLNKSIVSKKRIVSCSLCKIKKSSIDMISTKNTSSNSPTYICSLNCVYLLEELPQSKSKKTNCDNCLSSQSSQHKSKSKSKHEKKSSSSRVSTRQSSRKVEKNLSDNDGIYSPKKKSPKFKNKVARKISYKDNNVLPKVDKEVQTDQTGNKGIIIPVPVPVYIPMPMHMYVMPYPVPVPLPIPLPIPIFIPTTKNTTKEIFEDIKKIREETPNDPFEAELLLMAGMVADDQKNENDLSSDDENDVSHNNNYNDDTKIVSSSARNHNSFGDDVLAMALNMAGADTESLEAVDDISAITSNNQVHQIIDDVEANLVSSTIMPQTPDPLENITQENMISSPQDMLNRPPRKRAPRSQSQRNTNSKRSRKIEYPQAQFIQSPAALMQQSQQQVVQNSVYSMPMSTVKPDANMYLKYTLGVNAWRHWATAKSIEFEKTLSSTNCSVKKTNIFKLDPLQLTASELNYCLCLFVKEVRKPNGSEYAPDTIYYLCLGIQQYLFENGRIDNIFTDMAFEQFTNTLNEVAIRFTQLYNDKEFIVTRVEEEYLWESKQLGAHSPYVLLCTLIFYNTKHFNLGTVEEHMQLSFSHIMKHWKRNPNQPSTSGVKAPGTYRNVLLRFYPPQASLDSPNSRKKKVYEQHENEENPLRCPVKLYEFYLSKCPESVKTRNDLFYLTPERSCVPDSPVWYSTCALNKESIEKMLNRVKMVKEINVALLTL